MFTFKQICESIGFDIKREGDAIPDREYKFFAYKNGESREFETESAAREFSSLVEKVVANGDEIAAATKRFDDAYARAHELWYNELRVEHGDVSSEVFALCYDMAYARAHHAGRDEIANVMVEYVQFAERVIAAVSGNKWTSAYC